MAVLNQYRPNRLTSGRLAVGGDKRHAREVRGIGQELHLPGQQGADQGNGGKVVEQGRKLAAKPGGR